MDTKKTSQIQAAFLEEDKPPPAPKKDNRLLAIFAINVFAISNIIVGASYKYIALQGVSLTVFWLCRATFTLLTSSIELLRTKTNPFTDIPVEPFIKRKMLARVCIGNTTFILFNLALPYVPIFIARILLQISPFWITFLSYCINDERVTLLEFIGIVICFCAVLVIALNQSKHGDESQDDDSLIDASSTIGVLAVGSLILGSFTKAGSDVMSRALKNVYTSVILFYHSCFGITISGCILLTIRSDIGVDEYTSQQWTLLGVACVFSTIAINANTISYQSDNSGFVALLSYITLVWAYFADQIIFDESFYVIEMVAAFAILSTTLTIAIIKLKEK